MNIQMMKWLLKLPLLTFMTIGGSAVAADLDIEILTAGDGITAEAGKRVTVHYEGRLTDGTVFDASRNRGQPFAFTIGSGQVIRGWEQGVAGMKIGETRRLTIPPELGYGANGAGNAIPPNATLVFDIELLTVSDPIVLGVANNADLQQVQKKGVVVIDIRRPDEWASTGIIEGAETITAFMANGRVHPEFLTKFRSVVPDPATPVMLYCRTGNRTTSLGNALIEQLGYTNVAHLKAGITGWMDGGNTTITYTE